MVEFSELPEEFKKTYYICFYLIQFNHFNFFNDEVPFFKKYWRFLVNMLFISIQFVSITAYLIRQIQNDLQIPELSYLLSSSIILFQGFVKCCIVLYHKTNIQNLIVSLGLMWKTNHLTNTQIENQNRFVRILTKGQVVCYWSFFFSLWINLTTSLFITLVRKFVLHQNTELLLAFGSILNHADNWFLYIIIYLHQTYTVACLSHMYIGLEMLIITLCGHLSTAFYIVREDLKNMKSINNQPVLNESVHNEPTSSINNIIKQHQKLIGLMKLLNDIFNKIVFMILSCATLEVCFFSFACIVSNTPSDLARNILAITVILPLIYILCHYSELLRKESNGIAEAAYEHLWYHGDASYQKSICLIILRAQRPCSLMSLNYIPITLNTFIKVMSTTWSYLSLAITVYSKK